MSMDKVASSPAFPTIDGWPAEESPLNENETAALNVALGVGISVIANAEEPKERHTVADLASIEEATLSLPMLAPTDSSDVLLLPQELQLEANVSLKLQTLAEMSESLDVSMANTDSDSEDHSHSSSSKIASFYIGDEQACSRDNAAVCAQEEPLPNPPLQLMTRRVQISDQQTKMKTIEFIPPDGGYGWVIALAACVVNTWIVGFIKSYGVLYIHH
ncbi:hypothetical protein SK128_010437 [Halocaridina rubra]|uniref:Uncharacterized protein n=1 Tax=Halocaridina rubra TaxID=373956 RepID=A0AAN8ZVE7_HALRR